MKQFSLILNIVLLFAVGILYYLHFSGTKVCEKKVKPMLSSGKPGMNSAPCIAYVDLDSLNEKITFIKNNRKALETEQEAIESEWESGYRNLENQKNNFLKKGKAITQSEAEEFQANLVQQQQEIDTKKQVLTQKLNEKSYKFMDGIQQKLKGFLEEYNKNNKFNYIFSTGNGLDYMVFKDTTNNITSDVITGMNEMIDSENK